MVEPRIQTRIPNGPRPPEYSFVGVTIARGDYFLGFRTKHLLMLRKPSAPVKKRATHCVLP